jgi:hypothetical protein
MALAEMQAIVARAAWSRRSPPDAARTQLPQLDLAAAGDATADIGHDNSR